MAGAQLARRELLACSEASESASEGGYDMTPIGIPPDAASELVALRARVAELEAELGRSPEGEGKSGAGSRLAPALESPRRISSSASVPANVLMDKYLGASPMRLLGGRLPWLVALLLLQSTAALVMAMFEELLDRELVIAFFVPMIVGTGGNAGNQPGVAVTRALGLGIPPRGVLWKIMRREAALGLVTSTVLTAVSFARVVVEYPDDLRAAGAISISVFVMINLSVNLGVLFSILMESYNVDPANGAAPLLTTLTDLIGITVLCGVSALFFHELVD